MNRKMLLLLGSAALILTVFLVLIILLGGLQPVPEVASLPTLMALPTTAAETAAVQESAPDEAAAPPVDAAPTASPPTAALPLPTPEPTLRVKPLPTVASIELPVPEQPVPSQVVITFNAGASSAEKQAYVQQLGGTIRQDITSLNAVVVSVPEAIAAQPLPPSPAVAASEPDYFVVALADTADPMYGQQWSLPVINAPAGWASLPADAPQIAVAVIDSGVCADHPDLAGSLLPGYDFIEDDAAPQDDYGHGCAVAGVIAARSNDIGIAGIAPNARIMPLRVLNNQGLGTYSDVAAAIVYAADNGAQIINLSLGGSASSSVLQNAVDYAVGRGVLVVAAAGNTGGSVLYPAAYAPVIAVASVDQNLQRSSFSSFGPEVDLFAPGRDILTTARDGGYTTMTGTSFAAPEVSGIAALELGLGRSLQTGNGIVSFGGLTSIGQPTPTPIATEEPLVTPPSGEIPLRVMVPSQQVAKTMRANATSLSAMFPQMDPQKAFSLGPMMDLNLVSGQASTFKTLAILVQFSGNSSSTSAGYFDDLLFSASLPSVRSYYNEVSYSQFDIVTVNAPSTLGWRTAPYSYSYYVNGQNCTGAYPNNCQKLTEDLVAAVNPVVDFSQYDNNHDGWVDTVFIIHAGPGAEYTGSDYDVWSHSWQTRVPPVVDGVRVGSYTTEPEYWGSPGDMTHGVYAHELGHALGLPDLYDVDYSSEGVGQWSLMAGGSWNGYNGDSPAHFDPWSRINLGFAQSTTIASTEGLIPMSIPNIEENSSADVDTIFRINTRKANEYFLIENRQWIGSDTGLPGDGLLIWHIDDNVTGWYRNRYECLNPYNWYCPLITQHYQVSLEQADGYMDLEWGSSYGGNGGDGGDPFPGWYDNFSFDFYTMPNTSSYYSSADPGIYVYNISYSASTMTFDLEVAPLATPVQLGPSNTTPVANPRPPLTWTAVSGATGYQVKLGKTPDLLLDPVYNVVGASFTPPMPLLPGEYYWQVRATGPGGIASRWTGPRYLQIVTAPGAAPGRNFFTISNPTLYWGRVSWATEYRVQVDDNLAFTSPNFTATVLPDVLQVVVDPAPVDGFGLSNGTYYWRVCARTAAGVCTYSPYDSFVIEVP